MAKDEIEYVEVNGELVADWRPKLTPKQRREVEDAKAELLRNLSMMRALREELGVTQEELAKLLGMTQSAVSKLEAKREPKLSVLRKLVEHKGGKLRLMIDLNGRQTEWPYF